uniref:Myb/SANT-like domain-containing protein n=2 Tax=Oryza TaxID=4527 RepID=A0A0D3G6C4_9ORYZ
MAGNNMVWQPQVVEEMLRYYKEKIQAEGRQFIFKEVHYEECAKQINEKYHTKFTSRQVYHKFHKLKAQWKVIMEAKNLSGANFDDVEKRFLYDETEVVQMNNFINLQASYDHPMTEDTDFIGEKNGNPSDVDPSLHYDSDYLPEENNNRSSSSSKRPKGSKIDKGKRVKADDNPILHITGAMNNMSDTMRFTRDTSK